MPSFNSVTLMGHLVRDAESRALQSGTTVTNCAIAVSEKWKDKSGEKQERTAFVDLTLFGEHGERFRDWTGKGSLVLIVGKLRQDTWEDKDTGAKCSKLSVVVDRFENLDPPDKSDAKGKRPAARREAEDY